MTNLAAKLLVGAPDPENPGWHEWVTRDATRFNGVVIGRTVVRQEGERSVRLRMVPRHIHTNVSGTLHGGLIMAFIDVSLFATIAVLGAGDPATSVTLEATTQFIGAGAVDRPLDAVTEVIRETRRIVFLRGLVVQGDVTVAAYSATLRKFGAA